MARIRVKWNNDGLYELRSCPGVQRDLEARGRRILEAAGGEAKGYKLDSRQGLRKPQGRWRVTVAAVGRYAKRSNAKHNSLINALPAGK